MADLTKTAKIIFKNKKMRFMRKNADTGGIYQIALKEGKDSNGQPTIKEKIKIEGRSIFETKDKKIIETLRKDEELIELEKEEEKEEEEEEKEEE